ncbi:MAG: FG-GAP-like repeat-containing protein, partial [Chitinophagales bacterium]
FSIEGNQDNANFGSSLATTNDVNGDGVFEILISAPNFDGGQTDEGIVYLYDIIEEELLWSYESNQANAKIGIPLSANGDINNDGYADIMIGSENYDAAVVNAGAVIFFYGDPVSLNAAPDLIISGDQSNSSFGHSCGFAGDINADGNEDIICGAPNYDNGQTDEGRLFIYFGSMDGFYTVDPFIYEVNQPGANLGMSTCGKIQINNDVFSDIAVAATGFDNGELNEGAVFLFTGNSTGLNLFDQLEINQPNAAFGNSISFLSDINNDHSDEILVGVPMYDDGQTDEGGVFIYLSSSPDVYDDSSLIIITSNIAGFQYGEFVKSCVSLNDDNLQEILIGCPNGEEGELNEGLAYIYFTDNLLPNPAPDYPIFLSNTFAGFTYNPLGNCDINGDGFEDLIIGHSTFDNGQTDEGKIMIFFGSSTGIDSIVDQEVERNLASFFFGGNMAVAGDVNNDGYDDLVFGKSSFSSPQTSEGVVELYLGGPSGLIFPYYRQYQGNATGRYYGHRVEGAGDINGDGIDDFIASCGSYSNGQTSEGAILVFLGNTVSLSTLPSQVIESNVTNKLIGSQLAVGDVNGDGYSDVVASYAGSSVELYYGSSAGLNTFPSWSVSNPDNSDFNETIEVSPDVNGDGFADIFI